MKYLSATRLLGCMIAALFLWSCNPKEKTVIKSLPEKLDSLVAGAPDFSGVILIAENGKPVYHKAFGFANAELKLKMDTASVFELASVSKQFTAMLIAMFL